MPLSYERDSHVPASYKLVRLQRVPGVECGVEVGAVLDYADGDGSESVMAHFHRTIQEDNEKMRRLHKLLNEHNRTVSHTPPSTFATHARAAQCHMCNGVE
jgi:hypothetical protein